MVKIARAGQPGQEVPCLVEGDDPKTAKRFDLSKHAALVDAYAMPDLAKLDSGSLPEIDGSERWGAPLPRPGKVVCIGLNYADHAAESGMPIPDEPIIFMKSSHTVVGPFDDVQIPRGSEKTDWEVELAVVIGRDARYLNNEAEAADYIAGYCICNDVSERHFQLERGGQWDKGKNCDTFCPLGPWIASADELGDIEQLDMYLDVNGKRCQTGNTSTMVFKPHFIVHYLSQFMTLEAGDVISTGTPPGVGLGFKPPVYLKAGDVMELWISGLGTQRQACKQA